MADEAVMLEDVALPERWIVTDLGNDCVVVDACNEQRVLGAVTIDFRRRGFRHGFSEAARLDSTGTYKGLGWRRALVAAAIHWLSEVLA